MITTFQKPLSQSHAVLRTGASHQTRGLRTRYRPPRATAPFRVLSTDEKLDKLMASAARFEQEYKAAGSIKQRLAAIDKGNPVIAKFREPLAQAAEREDLESHARKISEKHEHELREAGIDGAAKSVMPSVSKDEKEPTKPESKSLEEKEPPQAGSTKTYRSKTNKAETETPETKCICHRPLELDNTRVL
ncbi:hypothetical protein FAGAP_10097 [Fusarium agapanthi]|uniref:Uncharacterized protein n=1 Tax=Fusarium agapanthi TaxID=1803897 RepID=A0A9P5E432_9HYPO|nr:hypothetical protein FAGAP_10097 [Fusarium agapanthi]